MKNILYLAPLRGLTDFIYRNNFFKYFKGFDLVVAPFIATQKGNRLKNPRLKDLLPENNLQMPVIPQILGKEPQDFIIMAEHLFDMGYKTVNWNLGCPFVKITKKGRGSGMLPFPDQIDAFLEKIFSSIPNQLSIKTRLGLNDPEEILELIPIFNRYPLMEIIIHPRTGRQLYDGETDLETFKKCLSLLIHSVVYNGDIKDIETFHQLSNRFKDVNRWMIGRGALSNPFLPGTIKAGKDIFSNKIETFKHFHDTLFDEYRQILHGPSHLLDKMKGFWKYFNPIPNSQKIQKKILKTQNIDHYKKRVEQLFEMRNEE